MLPTISQIAMALHGVWLIACRKPISEVHFDISKEGFWKSLFAAVLVLPANILITFFSRISLSETDYGLHQALQDLLIYSITWLVYPLLIINGCIFFDKRERALAYLVPYNWASVTLGHILAAVTIASGHASDSSSLMLFLLTIVYAVAIFLFFEVARQGLKISKLAAIGVVTFDFILSIFLMSMLESLKL